MPKIFKYKDARNQIKYYKNLSKNLNNALNIKNENFDELIECIKMLQDKGFFFEVTKNALNDSKVYTDNINFGILLSSIYYYLESKKYVNICDSLLNTYKESIKEQVSSLVAGSNPILWFFTSKRKKQKIEESFNELEKLKNESFVESYNDVMYQLSNIKNIDSKDVKKDYVCNNKKYKDSIYEINRTVLNDNVIAPAFSELQDEYNTFVQEFNNIKSSIPTCKKEIRKSIDKLLNEEFVIELRKIPIEELSRIKPGIRIKNLKSSGYETFLDIYNTSVLKLSNVYGISSDTAVFIKHKCDEHALEIRKSLKVKLSVDKKTKASTDVVKKICDYKDRIELLKEIDELEKQYKKELNSSFNLLSSLGNCVNVPFMDADEFSKYKSAYKGIKDVLSSVFKPVVDESKAKFHNGLPSTSFAWEDFSQNSISYYNIIEEIYPEVLDTSDYVYGLPDEFAKEIQNEPLFLDGLSCTLRKYQEWGVKYIIHQRKVLLGDEMGLGKTIQAIASMVSLKNCGATHFFVVCPASVVTNWCREIQKHSNLNAILIYGSDRKIALDKWIKYGGVAVTNYESVSNIKLEDDFKFSLLIIDEAHYIKNIEAKRSSATRMLAKHTNRLLLMSGTALENKVDEMISLISVLSFTLASKLKSIAFKPSSEQFKESIVPVYYRRKREDVLSELPDKIESEEWCTLDSEEETIYEESIMNRKYQDARRVSWNVNDLNKSSKASRLKEIVEDAEKEGRKVLVFSFFLDTINKIYNFLKNKCLFPINGSVSVDMRQQIVDEFNKAPAGTVLLAQINTGGTGLNIQAASVVVMCEPQYKPSIENQAISRAYRMGQSRNVLVYRLLCENTVDERMMEILSEKQQIFDTFADKSIAGEQSIEINDKSFGNIIEKEYERISKKNENLKTTLNDSKVEKLNSNNFTKSTIIETGKNYYEKIMKMKYYELVQFLINKYGPAKYDYFVNDKCKTTNKKVKRTSEGLVCHHIDEDKAIMLCDEKYAAQNPFEYQKADRLVYCNYLEHLLLHILIAEGPKATNRNINETQGICGAVNFICKQLNDYYNGYQYSKEWLINTMAVIKDDYESYIMMLKKLWHVIKNNRILASNISKADLAKGSDGNVYPSILNRLNDYNIY